MMCPILLYVSFVYKSYLKSIIRNKKKDIDYKMAFI